MKIYFFAYTKTGGELCEKLTGHFENSVYCGKNEITQDIFQKGNALVFVGAAGIAVRKIAPFTRDKRSDPAVVVIDELGKFVIPVLSGHVGGANKLAREIAGFLSAAAVITTATDVQGKFAVDVWAEENGLVVLNPKEIKYISAAILEGTPVGFFCEFPEENEPPDGVTRGMDTELGICISSDSLLCPFPKTLKLTPKCVAAGMGCRKNTPLSDCEKLFYETLEELNIAPESVFALATVDLKKTEPGFIKLCENQRLEFLTYTAGELEHAAGDFSESEFVKKTAGVSNVCERAAVLASGNGELFCRKRSRTGVTIALARKAVTVKW